MKEFTWFSDNNLILKLESIEVLRLSRSDHITLLSCHSTCDGVDVENNTFLQQIMKGKSEILKP